MAAGVLVAADDAVWEGVPVRDDVGVVLGVWEGVCEDVGELEGVFEHAPSQGARRRNKLLPKSATNTPPVASAASPTGWATPRTMTRLRRMSMILSSLILEDKTLL